MTSETQSFEIPVLCKEDECERCQNKLTRALEEVKGVSSSEVRDAVLSVSYNPNILTLEKLRKKTKEIGCEIAEKFSHETLDLAGLDCPDCAMKMERSISRIPGVIWVSVNFASSTLGIEFETERVSLESITALIKELGYQIISKEAEEAPNFWEQNKRSLMSAVSGVAIALGFITSLLVPAGIVSIYLYAAAILFGGYFIARRGLASLRLRTMDMNFLVTLAAVAAASIGEWLEGALVLFLFSVGNTLESYAMERNRRELRSLIEQSPKEALVRRAGSEIVLDIEKILIGDIAIVKPGEKIPVDGVIVSGGSAVDQSPITGESLPVDMTLGDNVFAGSINGHGSLEVKVAKMAADSTIAKVLLLVERAQEQKAPAQLFTERFGRLYTPAVVFLAAAIAVTGPLFGILELSRSLYLAAVLLVVSCPCALVISVPVAIVSAIANAAGNGVLIKGGAFLEIAGSLSAVAFDKTGTLTEGRPEVTDIINFGRYSPDQVLQYAAAVESRSEHPIAKAIHRAGAENEVMILPVKDFQAYPGGGAGAEVEGIRYYIGSHRFFQKMNLPSGKQQYVNKLEDEGKSVLFLGSEQELIGLIAFTDRLRSEGIEAIESLKKIGIGHLAMLTGDNQKTATIIAAKTNISEFHAELLPEDKVDVIREMQHRFGKVAMIGDGVNDAPALAAADLGVAMGAAGTDVALETADVALMSDDISKLPYAVSLSRKALRIIKQNIVFSLLVIAILIASTLFGRLTLSLGIIGHEGSALLVIANGMRLLRSVR